jgi:cytochrome c7-like protein
MASIVYTRLITIFIQIMRGAVFAVFTDVKWRTTVSALFVLILTGLMAVGVGMLYSAGSSDLAGQDVQPLSFSHAKHAGELKIDCMFCHRSVSASAVAGVPSVRLCVGCHRNLAHQTRETEKLLVHWNNRTPTQWVRLHRLPDFVYFTHEMHLRAGHQCIDCHGRVDQMSSTPRAASYEMGWCLSCHEKRGASRDCWTCHM